MRSSLKITTTLFLLSFLTLASSSFLRAAPSPVLLESLKIDLPDAELTGVDLIYWNHVSKWTYICYLSGGGYQMNITNATFVADKDAGSCPKGTITLKFDAFGNASWGSNGTSAWAMNMNATIKIFGTNYTQIMLNRMPEVQYDDIIKFLRDWTLFSAMPYLKSLVKDSHCPETNSSVADPWAQWEKPANTSSKEELEFPSMNFTAYDLENWNNRRYMNYTWTGFSVYVYNFVPNLSQRGGDVYGSISFNFNVFGNDTSYPCVNSVCRKTYEYSNATIYVNSLYSEAYFRVDRSLAVNASDVENFLRGYYNTIMIPKIVSYYGFESGKNTTSNANDDDADSESIWNIFN